MKESNDELTSRLPPDWNTLISEAILNARVQRVMGAPPPKPWYSKLMGHSAFTPVLTVLLTFAFGTVLAQRWENARVEATKQIEQERRQKEALIGAYNDFLGTLSEQKARSLLVDQAIHLKAPLNELTVLVRNEQETFAKAQQKAAVLSFTIRELVSPEVYEQIHNGIKDGLIEPLDGAMRGHAFIYSKVSDPSKTTDWTNAAADIDRVAKCGTAVSHAVWYNTIAPSSTNSNFISRKEESMKHMEEICKR